MEIEEVQAKGDDKHATAETAQEKATKQMTWKELRNTKA